MSSDDESNKKAVKLETREEFPGWKERMGLLALEKGDFDGVFSDLGIDPNVGYQLYPPGAGGNAKRSKWMELSKRLVGKVGGAIDNSALRRVWTDEKARIEQAGVGPPDERPYMFAKCMAALEQECARKSAEANQIARGEFTIALQSFMDKATTTKDSGSRRNEGAGFAAYVDRIRNAEEKLRLYGVIMADEEKKQLFFSHFNANADHWPTLLTVWKQDNNLTFDDI